MAYQGKYTTMNTEQHAPRRRVEPLLAPMRPIQAAERLASLAAMVVAASIAGERERTYEVVDRFVSIALAHLGDVGPSMWSETEGALWRTFHLALLGRARALMRAVLLDEPATELAGEMAFVAVRYRRAVSRRCVRGAGFADDGDALQVSVASR